MNKKTIFLSLIALTLCFTVTAFDESLCSISAYQGTGAILQNYSFCYLNCSGPEDMLDYDGTLAQQIGSDFYEPVYANTTGIVNMAMSSIYESPPNTSYCDIYEAPFTVYCEGTVYNVSEDYTAHYLTNYTFNCTTTTTTTTTTTNPTTTTTLPAEGSGSCEPSGCGMTCNEICEAQYQSGTCNQTGYTNCLSYCGLYYECTTTTISGGGIGNLNSSMGNGTISGINYGTLPYNITWNLNKTTILGLSKSFFITLTLCFIFTIIILQVKPVHIAVICVLIALSIMIQTSLIALTPSVIVLIFFIGLLAIYKARIQ